MCSTRLRTGLSVQGWMGEVSLLAAVLRGPRSLCPKGEFYFMRRLYPHVRQWLALAALWPTFAFAALPAPSEWGEVKLFRLIKSSELGQKAKGTWRNMELDFKAGANVNFDKLDVLAQYRYRLDQSFKQGEYLRTDEWRLKKTLKVGNIINEVNTPLLFDVTKDLGIQFIRQFKDRRKAMTAAPYHIKHLPLTSELAISRLQPGDFIVIPSVLTLFLGYNHRATYGVIESTTRTAYFVKGTFLLHFYRMSGERMRVKIFSYGGKGLESSLRVGLDYKVFVIDLLDQSIGIIFDDDIIQVLFDQAVGDVFIDDYIFDLKHPEAREAYDNFISPRMVLNSAQLIEELFKGQPLSQQLLSDLASISAIAQADESKEAKRITRITRNQGTYRSGRMFFGLDLVLFELDHRRVSLNNYIHTLNNRDQYPYFFNYTKRHRTKVGMGPLQFSKSSRQSMLGVFATERKVRKLSEFREDEKVHLRAWGVSSHRYQAFYHSRFKKDLLRELRFNLPEADNLSQIDWSNKARALFPQEGVHRDAQIFFQFFINDQGLDIIRQFSKDDFGEKIIALSTTPILKRYADNGKLKSARRHLTRLLFETFSNHSPLSEKKKAIKFASLKGRFNLIKYTPLLIKALLEGHDMTDLVTCSLTVFAEGSETLSYQFGSGEFVDTLQVQFIDNVISEDSINILREMEQYKFN